MSRGVPHGVRGTLRLRQYHVPADAQPAWWSPPAAWWRSTGGRLTIPAAQLRRSMGGRDAAVGRRRTRPWRTTSPRCPG
ncbi:hypothetical protein QJS66_14730 [Kocuria rhizophila]|nr:hypothetical protein QJS66_14730 [Kocuria rhizophila]